MLSRSTSQSVLSKQKNFTVGLDIPAKEAKQVAVCHRINCLSCNFCVGPYEVPCVPYEVDDIVLNPYCRLGIRGTH
jgi:hypothetical protein